jgi:type III restriction enzyme
MSVPRDAFPLASGIRRELDGQVERIVAGEHAPMYDLVTPITEALLRFWFQADFCDIRRLNFHEGQRDAILHIIYAHEALGARTLRELYEAVASEAMLHDGVLDELTKPRHQHPKYAAKMATGTGKTWVLNALLVWQYLNKMANPSSEKFTSNFLIVAPGLIVYDRLQDSFLGKERGGVRDFLTADLHVHQDLFIPETFRDPVFSFLQSSVVTKGDIGRKVTGGGMIALTNWHLLAGVEDPDFVPETEAPGADVDAAAAIKSFFPVTPGVAQGNALGALDRAYLRGGPLQSLVDLPDLMVFNDEAHHIHEVKKGEEITEVEWQKSLMEIASTKGPRFVQVDFSATPFNETSKGKAFFPHIVVDFDLSTAMKLGLVKALALDKRREVAALPLDFKAERDEQKRVAGLSQGQRVMLGAGLTKLQILEEQFAAVDDSKHPKMLVMCEDTNVTGHVVEYLQTLGLGADDILAIDSNRKGEMSKADWDAARERLFDVDRHPQPKVIVSVLMLREGFDVNNVCVIVPLRASKAKILLEQTVGRGLRIMWRGDERIDELKSETRVRIRDGKEPDNYFDVLFIVEHPAFSSFYDELMEDGLAAVVGDASPQTTATGDLETVGLRDGYEAYDFAIPLILREAEEALGEPTLDPRSLPAGLLPFDSLKSAVGKGDLFVSEDAQTRTRYGDYRVDGGVMTATGYNDYLSRMTTRVTDALGSAITRSAATYGAAARFPFLQQYKPQLAGWIDVFIRERLFDTTIDPMVDENWRVLLIDDVAHRIAGTFASALVEAIVSAEAAGAEVVHRLTSEVDTITVRSSSAVEAHKCIYDRLPVPSRAGGLERSFIEWADTDTGVEAFLKIHEFRHDFLHRPYLKADGMPAYYSPDFLVRTEDRIYVVETKATSALTDENVQRKQLAAVAWCEQINRLPEQMRSDREWYYVLLGEQMARDWIGKNGRLPELLEYARLRRVEKPAQERLI